MTRRFFPAVLTMAAFLTVAFVQAADFTNFQYEQFEKCTFQPTPDGPALPYRFYKPELKDGEKYPLILYLHGAGEVGNDNDIQLTAQDHFLHLVFSKVGQQNPAFVVAPQCPSDKRWTTYQLKKNSHVSLVEPSEMCEFVHQLVKELERQYPQIDTQRLYVTGLSMGGFGTWDWLVWYADETAAAVPICGGADPERLANIPAMKTLPIWIFHGADDPAVNVRRSRYAYSVLSEINPNVRYTEYTAAGHLSWIPAYRTTELATWLFQQKRVEPK